MNRAMVLRILITILLGAFAIGGVALSVREMSADVVMGGVGVLLSLVFPGLFGYLLWSDSPS